MSSLNFSLQLENNDSEAAKLQLQLLFEYDSELDSKLQIEIWISWYFHVLSKKFQRQTLKSLQKSVSWTEFQNYLRIIRLEPQHVLFK